MQKVTRGATWLALAIVLVAFSGPAFGQGTPGNPTPGQQAGQPTVTVKKLSVEEAVQMALEQNLNLQVQRLNPQMRDIEIATARAGWTPNVTSSFSNGNSTEANYNRYTASGTTTATDSRMWSVGANQLLPTGTQYSLSWGNQWQKSDNLYQYTNPILGASLGLTLTQPLMRNFKIDGTRQQLLVSRKNREMSDLELRQAVLGTMRNVKSAYWDLAYSVASLKVQQESLDLARESLKNNEARVRIGTMAPIDIIQAQAEVASRDEAVIRAQAAVDQSEDRFRALIMDPQTPGFWSMKFELTDAPNFQPIPVDVDAAVQRAISARTDLAQQRKGLEESDINLRYMKNQALPDVSLQAKYSMTALGGTTLLTDPVTGLPSGISQIGYGSVMRSLLARDLPTWSLALNFSYPIGTSAADANLARARLQYSQAQTQLRAAELSVATQVRDAARAVTTNQKRVESTRASRELQEKKLEAEQKKFAAGMQTTFFVLQAQRDLSQARDAELQAVLDYMRSIVDFETVQQAPVSGGSGGGIIVTPGGQ